MKEDAPRVIKIPAKPEATRQTEARRQLRVAAYCRVSTKEEDQANSYEVQKEYYTDKIMSNTAWTMAGIFADKGITGTSAKKREDFMRMIRHCRQKKIDVILTKSVSRFSRNTVDCLYYIRALKQLGIAVIFEKENINSLEEDSELRITLSGAFAQSESESISANVTWGKRRAMEAGKVSIQYKKLYGYRKGEDGQPEIIPEQAEIVRWLYERYLTGASLRMIKDELEQQGVKCFEDSPEWTISRIRSILQNEKYCGDVLMQKTFRQDFINRKAIKNTGQLPMYLIENHHEGIVSRDDFIAVQHLLNNSKYGHRSILPELRVIDSGLLKGFVTINPRWAGFKPADYFQASASIHPPDEQAEERAPLSSVTLAPGDFDMRGFEITRSEFFDNYHRPYVQFQDKRIKFSTACVRTFGKDNHVELLVNPVEMKFAVRTAEKGNRNAVLFSKLVDGKYQPREIAGAAYMETLFQLFGWSPDLKYRIAGRLFQSQSESAYIFDLNDAEAFIKSYLLSGQQGEQDSHDSVQPLSISGKRVRAVPEEWIHSFGTQYYLHQQSFQQVHDQSEEDWKIRIEGQLYETGQKLHVTGFEELRDYIRQEFNRRGKEEP